MRCNRCKIFLKRTCTDNISDNIAIKQMLRFLKNDFLKNDNEL